MSKLVSHEVEISFSPDRLRQQSNQMQDVDPVEDRAIARRQLGHARVHLGVHQPKGQRLVSNKRLIMTLVIGHILLSASILHPFHGRTGDW